MPRRLTVCDADGLNLGVVLATLICMLLPGSAAVAANPVTGEFGGQCAMSLSEGKRVTTDCSITWVAEDGKTYCFGSEEARRRFLGDPEGHLDRARQFLAAGEAEATSMSMEHYTGEEVKAFVEGVIKDEADRNGGLFPIHDPLTDQNLNLAFDKVDFMRTLHGYGFFPDVIFHARNDPDKKYLVDFWVKPGTNGLEILDTRIYKAPKWVEGGWQLMTRQPKPWWWIPASEHPGETEQKRGWEVMSAIEAHIVAERARNNGIYRLKDDQTGEEIALEFVGTHQPVRRLQEDGRFFACTDFRRQGSREEFYDIDFWLDEKDGSISVGDVRIHKVPQVQEDGSFIQVPRYDFDDLKFDVVP